MANMRAQLSVQFFDEELFYNFVKPYKEQRLLNNLIVKCLSAYYYDSNVRDMIEGTSLEDVADVEEVSTTKQLIDDVRQALIMQDFMARELQSTIDNGTEDMENLLNKTNEMAESSGVAKTTSSPSGSSLLRVGVAEQQKEAEKTTSSESEELNIINNKLNLVIQAVEILASASGNIEVKHLFSDVDKVKPQPETKTPSQKEENVPVKDIVKEVKENEPVVNSVVENSVNTSEKSNDDDLNLFEEELEIPSTPMLEDASASMNDLMSSIF